jgi:hypothetical protein
MYISRLISHAAGWRTHVLLSVGKHAARCKPLFAVYSALKILFCSNYISSLVSVVDWVLSDCIYETSNVKCKT